MRSIVFKFKLKNPKDAGFTTIEVTRGFKPIHFGRDPNNDLCVWMEGPMSSDGYHLEQFLIVGTGRGFDSNDGGWKHFQSIRDGDYMWHLYHFRRD